MYSIILLSGGSGKRMHNSIPKQYMLLAGKPIIMHTIERINKIEKVKKIIIVAAENYFEAIELMLKQYGITKDVVFAPAGTTRQESVYNGLQYVDTEYTIIHEAARPFVKLDDFNKLIEHESPNITYGLPIPFTVIKGDKYITGNLERSELVNVQLPQKFKTELLKKSHINAKKDALSFTEDASLIFHYYPEEKIEICNGMEYDIKLTTRQDMIVGEIIYDEVFRKRK